MWSGDSKEEEVNDVWLLGTCLGALQCWSKEVGEAGKVPADEEGHWALPVVWIW